MVLLRVGEIFFATHRKGASALWHCTGEVVANDLVRLEKIWRDDKARAWDLVWFPEFTGHGSRIVKGIELRKGDLGERLYEVTNPRHIFDYDKEDEEHSTKNSLSTDTRLVSLFFVWCEVLENIYKDTLRGKELDEACLQLTNLEKTIIETRADTNEGILQKMKIINHYVDHGGFLDPSPVPELIKSVMKDLEE